MANAALCAAANSVLNFWSAVSLDKAPSDELSLLASSGPEVLKEACTDLTRVVAAAARGLTSTPGNRGTTSAVATTWRASPNGQTFFKAFVACIKAYALVDDADPIFVTGAFVVAAYAYMCRLGGATFFAGA